MDQQQLMELVKEAIADEACNFGVLGELTVVEPFAGDYAPGSVGVMFECAGFARGIEKYSWETFVEQVEAYFARVALDVDLGHTKVDDFGPLPLKAKWVVFPARD